MPVEESVLVMIARIDENVIEMRRTLGGHLEDDKKIMHEVIRPLWEKHQQNIGSENTKNWGGMVLDKVITVGLAVGATWAAVKGLGGRG